MTAPDLFSYTPPSAKAYPDRPGAKAAGTSQEAAERIESRAETLRAEVLHTLRTGPSRTADEIASALRESVLSVRPRVSELAKKNLIWKTGERRTNRSGMTAHVWTAAKLEDAR